MAEFETVAYEPARRDAFLGLMREVWDGAAWSQDEFAWWFERHPAGRFVATLAERNGEPIGAVAQSYVRAVVNGAPADGALTLHIMTAPDARGRGVFSALQLHNEQVAAKAGATFGLCFPNDEATPILRGRLGWEELCRPRLWARLKRPAAVLRRRAEPHGGVRGAVEPFGARHAEIYRRAAARWPSHVVRDTTYLEWRYRDSPRPYASVSTDRGFAVVGWGVFRGLSTGLVCELVGAGAAALLRRCVALADADVVVALPNPGEHGAYLAAGFLPTPATLNFVGRSLDEDVQLPRGRRAWHLSLGDVDVF